MTKQEAIEAMQSGERVTHELFSDQEFIYYKHEQIHCERGYNIDSEFWMWRHSKEWLTGWSIYK